MKAVTFDNRAYDGTWSRIGGGDPEEHVILTCRGESLHFEQSMPIDVPAGYVMEFAVPISLIASVIGDYMDEIMRAAEGEDA